jgi:hypothetical protein
MSAKFDATERGADGAAGGNPDRLDVVVDRHCITEFAADERFAQDIALSSIRAL